MPYLTGGISIVVLALGSTAPGLLGFFINKFSAIFPDYRERVLGHEAAHFLVSSNEPSYACVFICIEVFHAKGVTSYSAIAQL